jgi:lambda family phage portal protein
MLAALGRTGLSADEAGFRPRASASRGDGGRPVRDANGPYRSASFGSQETVGWWPDLRSADAQTLRTAPITLGRVRDLLRNDPTAGAALQRLADLLVGQGLHVSSWPDAEALGIAPEAAHQLARDIQREWRMFANDPARSCDAQRKLSMNGLLRLMGKTFLSAGEATGALTWRDGPRYSTCVQVVDPDRVSNPYFRIDTMTMRGGVELDIFGAPLAYHVRDAHAGDWWASSKAFTWTRVPRETATGRPVFFHGFEPEREGQTRAVSPFASLVGRLRMLDKFAESELASAVANALLFAFVETDLPTDEVAERMTQSTALQGGPQERYMSRVIQHFTENPAKLGGVRMPVFPPGSKVTMNSAPRQTAAFHEFERVFVNRAAARLGLPGELLTDFSRTNYSSARAALNEMWRMVSRMRAVFVEQVVTPIWRAFLEEAFDKGYVQPPPGAPPFEEMSAAYLRARWRGPGRGYVDPVKEAEAADIRMGQFTSSLEMECAEQGLDWYDVLDQRAREQEEMKARNLTPVMLAVKTPGALPEDEPPGGGPEKSTP